MKEQIERCIEYLKQISLKEPIDFRVEEIVWIRLGSLRMVLDSFSFLLFGFYSYSYFL